MGQEMAGLGWDGWAVHAGCFLVWWAHVIAAAKGDAWADGRMAGILRRTIRGSTRW